MSLSGRLFVFEGMDSVGKTTLSQALAKFLSDRGEAVDWFAFPGRRGHTLGALVYDIHHNPDQYRLEKISPLANQALHLAAHIDAIENLILPALSAGKTVVLDRFWWSMIIYGSKGNVNKGALQKMVEAEKDIWSGIVPTALFVITRERPVDQNLWNSRWEDMQREYLALASEQEEKIKTVLIENQQTLAETLSLITSKIDELSRRT